MKSSSPLIFFLLFIIPVTAFSQFTLPFFEDFSESVCDSVFQGCSGPLPAGWTFPTSDEGVFVEGPDNEITWRAGTLGFAGHIIGNPHPAAYFYWQPSFTFYEFLMTTPTIYVGAAEQVKVFFDMELDYYLPNSTNGLNIKYRTPGQEWQQVLGYEVPVGVNVNFPLRTDSFIADVADSIQLGFEAYGQNSFHINSWDIDNVTVTALPQLTFVSIRSNNSLDSTLAVTGDTITLQYIANEPLIETSAIIAGKIIPEGDITPISGLTEWQATYEVKDTDEDGPVSFVTIFKAQYNAGGNLLEVDGNPKTTTTDNSLVVIDRTGPGEFELGAVSTFEALETDTIWYSNDDSLRMLVNIPPDTAIVKFLYSSGTSLSIDTDEFVTLNVSGNTIEPTDSLTVEAWIKPDATYENYDGFFSNADLSGEMSEWKGYGWFYFGSGWHFFLRTQTPAPGDTTGNEWPVAAVQSDEWSHLTATYDGTNLKTYRNGIITEQKPASGNIDYPTLSDDVWIGKFVFGSNNGFFDGKIDEVRIWSVARTQTEIQGYMNQSLTGNETGLIGYWRFDEGNAATVNDASPNNNNGTITGSDFWDTNDSPIDFKTDSLAYDKLVGAYVQLTDSTLGNQPLNIGNLNTLTQVDITVGQRTVTVTDTEYEAVTGIIDSSTHIIGARILDQAGNARTGNNPKNITVDNLSPSIDSAYTYNTENMRINFSEGLHQNNNGTGAVQKSDFEFIFEQNANIGGTAITLGDSINVISKFDGNSLEGGEANIQFSFTVDTVASGDETVEIIVSSESIIFDRYGNQMETPLTTGPINLDDAIPPYIDSARIAISNEYVDVFFTEGIFSASNPSINPAHFDDIIFDPGGAGNATNVSITSLTNDTGNPLSGGENTIRIYLGIVGPPSGTESIIIPPIENAIIDRGDNPLTDSSGILQLNKYPWIISESQHTYLDENNTFVQIVFSDTVYGSLGAAITNSDFNNLDFQQGTGGNATAANIADIRNTNDNILNTGEDTIRVFLDITGTPSGEETIEIRPLSETSIVNSINNPLATSDTLLFKLEDRLPPTIDSAYVNNTNDYIVFMASESLWTNSDHNLPLEENDFELVLEQNVNLGGNVTDVDITALTKIDGSSLAGGEETIKIELTLTNPPASGVEQILVKVKDGASIYDRNGNPMDSGEKTDSLTLYDLLHPYIDSLRIINTNEYANLYFSEGVFNSTGGPLGTGDFGDLNFLPGSDPGATDVQINYLRKSDGSSLSGGENQIRVYLTVSGESPSGTESIEIKPQDDVSIKDISNNYMDITDTSTDFLNSFPRIVDSTLSDENSYVQLIFNEDVYNSLSGPVSSDDFSDPIFIQGAGGNAENALINTITNANNAPLTTGEDTIRLVISLVNPPASGVETIEIKPLTSNSIFNKDGNPLNRSEATRTYLLNDRYEPFIYPNPTLSNDTILVIQTNEGIYTDINEDNQGVGMVLPSDFRFKLYDNGGNVDTARITVITDSDGSPLDPSGGDSSILINFSLFGFLPSGVEEVEIRPRDSTSIYDAVGNPMTSISERVLLPDRLPPRIIAPTAEISSDNSYVIFSLTEGVYGVSEITAPVEPNDFAVEFIPNGGNAIGAAVNYITNYRQFPLIGGEDILRCYLTIQGTPSGDERLYIRATNDNSVFDLAGNGMDTSQVTDTLQLYDQLVPTVDSVSIPHGSPIGSSVESPIMITFSEPIQSFGYSVSARHYSYLTYSTDTTATSFKVTLQPPMASLDTITLSIFNLTDNSGLEAVDFSYEFYTPPLGDYEPYDGKVNVLDLVQFVSFWMADSQPAILGLGPTSGTFPHLVPLLDEEYNLDDGMTFIRMWSWSLDRFGLEPLTSPTIGIAMNWDKLVVDIPMDAIAGQVYLRYNPLQGKVDLNHTAFGNNNLTLKREAVENGEILLEFGLVEPDDNARVISIKPEINEPAEATVIYKFFAADQSLIAAGTQKIALVIPTEFRLIQNYPNPFNNTTTIRYAVPEETLVQLEIFDIKGRLVETLTSQSHQPGFYALQWSGRRAASGVYFIKLEADKTVLTQKMILLK